MNSSQGMPKDAAGLALYGQASSKQPGRRRMTAPHVANEDLFLTLANDDDDNKSPAPSTSAAAPPPSYTAPGTEQDNNSRSLRYLQSLSQRSPPSRSFRQGVSSGQETPNGHNPDTGTPKLNGSNLQNGNYEERSEHRRSSQPQHMISPSPRRPSLRPADFAYSTPEAPTNSTISQPTRERYRRASHADADGAESEFSTNAPSTVWDEVNELKNRIQRLQYSGSRSRQRDVPGSAGFDRPRTGTTQTTVSTRQSSQGEHLSPKANKTGVQNLSDVHPLLHSALGKARGVVSRNVYNALESSAADALQMAAMARADMPSDAQSVVSSTIDGLSYSQRRVMRKADNLCRSLTELCIALCENNASSPLELRASLRPGSRDKTEPTDSYSPVTLSRRSSHTTERPDFQQSTLLSNRLAARQAANGRAQTTPKGPRHLTSASMNAPQDQSTPTPTDAGDTPVDPDSTIRGLSRALTDVGHTRPRSYQHSPRDIRLSRDYTNRHPLPDGLSPSIRAALGTNNQSTSTITTARTSVPAATAQPADSLLLSPASESFPPSSPERRRSARRGSTASSRAPPSTGAGLAERLEAKRQQRVASVGQLIGQPPGAAQQDPSKGRRPGSSRGQSAEPSAA